MSGIVLHHFEQSPFSEKIRLILGWKKLAWKSVLVPRILPKPDLMPLTGGYRRTPVLQVGADIYCDTQIIVPVLEEMHPEPSLFPAALGGAPNTASALSLAMWSDRPFFQTSVSLIFGLLGEKVAPEFIEDRAKMRGAPFDVAAMRASLPQLRGQYRAHCAAIEAQLKHDFLLGGFSLADINAYMNVWYLRAHVAEEAERLLASFPKLRAWEARVRAIGHGRREEITGTDALDIASAAKSTTQESGDAGDPSGRAPGDPVSVAPEDYARDPVRGRIVAISPQRIAIRREDPRVGEVVVHFPRVGFSLH